MNSISQESGNYIFIKNRTGSLTQANQISLPLTLEQCLINDGDNYQATNTTFNSALSCLYINYMYLYSKSFLVENLYPTDFPGYIGVFQNPTPSVLTISGINQSNLTSLTASTSAISFDVERFIESYNVTIQLSSISTPEQLAYTYLDNLTSVGNSALFTTGAVVSGVSAYTVSVSGIPSIEINGSYTPDLSAIFYTTSTYTSNSGDLNTEINNDFSNLVRYSFVYPLSAGHDEVIDIQVTKNLYTGENVIFSASQKCISIFTDNGVSVPFVYVNNLLGYNRNIDFQSITSIVLYGDFLYIGDKHYNSVYKVDVSGFTRNNPINSNRFIVDKIIGGSGNEIAQFNAPEPQFVYNDEVYIFDRNNSIIKIYDLNLNYIRSFNLNSLLRNTPPITTVKPFTLALYNGVYNIYYLSSYAVVSDTDTHRMNEILILDINNFNVLYSIKMSFNNFGETLVDLQQSLANKENIYIATNKNFYKFFLSNFSQIGNFSYAIYGPRRIGVVLDGDSDDVYVYQIQGKGFYSKFIETNNYISLLTDDNFLVYPPSELYVEKDENQTFVVYNKTFKKLFYNFYQLLTNINSRPFYILQTGTSFNSRSLAQIEYITNKDFDDLNTLDNKNYYVGENEVFSNSVLNRILTKYYELLLRGLSIISNRVEFSYTPVNLKNTNIDNIGAGSAYIMTESYSPSNSSTFQSIILTEDGRGITVETDQKPTPTPVQVPILTNTTGNSNLVYVSDPYSFIDGNSVVASPSLQVPKLTTDSPTVVTYLEATRTTATGDFRPVDYNGEYSKYTSAGGNTFIKPADGVRTIETLLLAKQQVENIVFSNSIRIRPELLAP